MKVILAEKKMAAEKIAHVLGINSQKEGYFEGNGYAVTWAQGHLCQLAGPEEYGFSEWNAESLPMIPKDFILSLDKDKASQFRVIKSLFEKADEIINAGDAGREGELIFRYIYTLTGCKKPFKRFWPKDLTDKGIERGMKELIPGSSKDLVYLSAKGRGEADWLVGMNATRSATVAAKGKLYTLGRVQTPVLALICKRYLENTSFKTIPYFNLKIELEKDATRFFAVHAAKFEKKEEADKILGTLEKKATCTAYKVSDKTDSAPLLFDLTELQKVASKKYKLKPAKTLQIAQDLYEKYGILSYPRTGSRYISEDLYDEIPVLLKTVAKMSRYSTHVDDLLSRPISKTPVDNSKVTDHHALLPTETDASKVELPEDHKKVFDLVVSRFLAAFSKDCIKEITKAEFLNAGHTFKASSSSIKFAGWRAIETEAAPDNKEDKEKEEEGEDEVNKKIPSLTVNDVLPCLSTETLSKTSEPKPLLTNDTLLTLMQTAGKELEDSELRKIMSSKDNPGIGTSATRAGIIENLYDRDFVMDVKNKIVPSPKGLALYQVVKDLSIASAQVTANWEKDFFLIEEGQLSYDQFLYKIQEFTKQTVATLLESCKALIEEELPCPKCKTGNCRNTPIGLFCQNEACDFKVFKEIASKGITDGDIKDLLLNKRSKLIKGFTGKENKKFDAYLVMDENYKVSFSFENDAPEGVNCPKCKGELSFGASVVSCKKEGCGFKLWTTIAKKTLSEKNIKDLISKGSTALIKGFTSTKTGKAFDAKIKFNKDFATEFEFEKK